MSALDNINDCSLDERIRYHSTGPGGTKDLYELFGKVFPPRLFPTAWRTAAQGGPPGGIMTFVTACRRLGVRLIDKRWDKP